ncbi:TPA: EAL domain-containing protein [Legionella pneumophila]|nr:EAL domain-containing protein [Legionella pneumophila]
MNAGYSSGWCEESFGIPLVASEVLCVAKGDDCCRFIMAVPSKIQNYIHDYFNLKVVGKRDKPYFNTPEFFKRKVLEEQLKASEAQYKNQYNQVRYRLKFEKLISDISKYHVNASYLEIDNAINFTLSEIGRFAKVDRVYIFLFSKKKHLPGYSNIGEFWANENLYVSPLRLRRNIKMSADPHHFKYMHNTHEWCSKSVEPYINFLQNIPINQFPWLISKLKKKKVVNVSDTNKLPKWALAEKKEFKREKIQSLLIVPMEKENSLVGFMGFDIVTHKKQWLAEDIFMLSTVADIVIQSILKSYTIIEHESIVRYFDPLTRLPNKELFVNYLQAVLSNIEQLENCFSFLILLNIDEFHIINDAYGTPFGDQLLFIIAERLLHILPYKAKLCRLEADRFLILLQGNKAEILKIADEILSMFNHVFKLNNCQVYLQARIGVTKIHNHSDNPEKLIQQASLATRQARLDNIKIAIFEPNTEKSVNLKLNIQAELHQAITENQLVLHYQPQFCTKTKHIVALEALLRWMHPKKGLLYPSEFLDALLCSDLLLSAGEWVLKTVCAQSVAWIKQGLRPVSIAVNISESQFRQPNFVPMLKKILTKTNMDPCLLKLEVTEQVMIDHLDETARKLHEIEAHNIQIILDDFGTGYASLSYLHQLPISKLKIDKSFIKNMLTNKNAAIITKTIILLAKGLGIKSLAEGVETKEQFDILKQLGCDEIQGYYFSEPLPVEKIALFLQDGSTLNKGAF